MGRLLVVAGAVALAIACGVPEGGDPAAAAGAVKKCKDPAGCYGDGLVQPPEACDTGGVDTDVCNGGTCTRPYCGDRYVNASTPIPEQCDDGGNTAACDADCTMAACGDAYVNPAAGEQCDASVPGCSAQCRIVCAP